MDMQDKEFDQLFSSKFDNFEVEPSPMVWDNIASELDGKKGIRAILPYLSIAATILVVLTAGALLLQKGSKPTKYQTPTKLVANRVEPAVIPNKAIKEQVQIVKPADKIASNNNHLPNKVAAPATAHTNPANNNPQNVVKVDEPENTTNQPLLAAVKEPVTPETKATVPDNIQLSPKTLTVEPPVTVDRPAVMASVVKQEEVPVKKHGIHSLGGLINVLVAKIDKRQDKIIEFGDADDDDDAQSKVTGVNLGLIKINNKNNPTK